MRSAVRFPLRLPVDVKSGSQHYPAETSNISAAGLLFYMEAGMPLGSDIEFSITMPATVLGTPADVRVACTGRIVRIAPERGRQAVAAVIDEYRFESS